MRRNDSSIIAKNIMKKVEKDISFISESSKSCITNYSKRYIFPFAVDVDDCDPNPCANGACTDEGTNSYTCVCASGWTGTDCDRE